MPEIEEIKKMADDSDTITISIPHTPWFYSTIVLLVLLLTSIFTGGFSSITGMAVKNSADVSLIVLNDKNCVICNTTNVVLTLYQNIPNLKIKYVDYSEAEGKQLVSALNVKELPTYVFSSGIKDTEIYEYFYQNGLIAQMGDYYILGLPGNYIISAQESSSPRIDLFIMGLCPYGNIAVKNIKSVADAFGSELAFDIHYIAEKDNSGFTSLHGQPEVEEDLRQLCAVKNYANGFDYAYCFAEKFSACIEAYSSCTADQTSCYNEYLSCTEGINSTQCLESSGMELSVIESCDASQELSEDALVSEQLFISSSPTLLVNGKYKVMGALPANITQQFICSVNPGLKGCSVKINETSAVSASGTC